MLVKIQQTFKQLLFFFISVAVFSACQKDIDSTTTTLPETPELPDLTTLVRSSASGFVTDENSNPVENAFVKLGNSSAVQTDADGYFSIRNVEVVKNAAVVSVEKDGYFKGIKTYIATQDKAGFFRIRLIPKTISGTVSGNSGGDVTLTNGLKVSFPANAVVNAGSGAAYTGVVNVASYWINPTSATLAEEMPGDLRGLETDGELKMLTTYGMAAVELTGAGGELLQIASDKKATLTMPVPAAINGSAPATIPLWSFDETKGLWKQEGTATKTGNTYVGEVSHFSFWNCDVPANYVQFNCTVVDANGAPVPFAAVKISVVANPNNAAWGWTDSSGYVAGAIPGNASLLLEVFSGYNCGTSVYSQNFSSSTTNVSLGNVTVTTATILANVTGTATKCNGAPVTNGYIRMIDNGQVFRYTVNNGSFDFNALMCSSSSTVQLIAEDLDAMEQSSVLTQVLTAGANAVGNLQACGVTTNEFLTYSIDGANAGTFTAPPDSVAHSGNGTNTSWYVMGGNNSGAYAAIYFDITGISLGSTQEMLVFNSSVLTQVSVAAGSTVTITELGSIGEYIGGTFSGTLNTSNPTGTAAITGSFRVRRVL